MEQQLEVLEHSDKGWLLLRGSGIEKAIGHDRYNGGWRKKVEGLNKALTNGYSIVGDFVQAGTTYYEPGLYLDCDVQGSRKNHRKHYVLFRIGDEGLLKTIATCGDARDWAVQLWPFILDAMKPAVDYDALVAERGRLTTRLAEIDAILSEREPATQEAK